MRTARDWLTRRAPRHNLVAPHLDLLVVRQVVDAFGQMILLLMLTGQRRNEIGHLEWAEIFAEKRQNELPERRTKNGQPHIIPLGAPAMELLRGVSNNGSPHVFSRRARSTWPRGARRLRSGGAI